MLFQIGLFFVFFMGIAGFFECAYALDKADENKQVKLDEPYKCTVALLSSEVGEAGSFFGSGATGDYQLEVKLLGVGPLLLVRPAGQSIEKASRIYAASSIASNCNEFLIEFEEVVPDKNWSVAALNPINPTSQIKLKAKLYFGRPEEGEFRQIDLRVEIYSNGDDRPSDKLAMLRGVRYKYPTNPKDKLSANIFNRMSREVCGLVINVKLEKEKHQECVSSMMGR